MQFEKFEDKPFRLSHVIWRKRYFNPLSKSDIQQYKYFLDNNRWDKSCPFHLEWPYLSVTEMIRAKLIDAHIENMVKNGK